MAKASAKRGGRRVVVVGWLGCGGFPYRITALPAPAERPRPMSFLMVRMGGTDPDKGCRRRSMRARKKRGQLFVDPLWRFEMEPVRCAVYHDQPAFLTKLNTGLRKVYLKGTVALSP
jgi:hypothetical protein